MCSFAAGKLSENRTKFWFTTSGWRIQRPTRSPSFLSSEHRLTRSHLHAPKSPSLSLALSLAGARPPAPTPSLSLSSRWSTGLTGAALTHELPLCCHGEAAREGYSSNPTFRALDACSLTKPAVSMVTVDVPVDITFALVLATLWPHKANAPASTVHFTLCVCARWSRWGGQRYCLFHIWPVGEPIPGGERLNKSQLAVSHSGSLAGQMCPRPGTRVWGCVHMIIRVPSSMDLVHTWTIYTCFLSL